MSTFSIFPLLKWKKSSSIYGRGIMTGANANQEWLLSNFWNHLQKTNPSYPVTFLDFGMTKSAKKWCQSRGEVIRCFLPEGAIATKKTLSPITAKFWERIYPGNVFEARKIWFLKPLGFLKTSYQQTIWLDLDIEVRKEISDLFTKTDNSAGIAIAPTTKSLQKSSRIIGLAKEGETTYNTGVVAFCHRSPAISKWTEISFTRNREFLGDENSLSRALAENKLEPHELPLIYNWPFFCGQNSQAKAVHFSTQKGKQLLLRQKLV